MKHLLEFLFVARSNTSTSRPNRCSRSSSLTCEALEARWTPSLSPMAPTLGPTAAAHVSTLSSDPEDITAGPNGALYATAHSHAGITGGIGAYAGKANPQIIAILIGL